jgi:hypothetical protein
MSRFDQNDAEGERDVAEANAHIHDCEATLGLFILYIRRRC